MQFDAYLRQCDVATLSKMKFIADQASHCNLLGRKQCADKGVTVLEQVVNHVQ